MVSCAVLLSLVSQMPWQENFQTTPPGNLPAGWTLVYDYNTTGTWEVQQDTCYFHIFPAGEHILCVDMRQGFAGIDSTVDVVETPAIAFPFAGYQQNWNLAWDWGVQQGTLRVFVRYDTGAAWTGWDEIWVQWDQNVSYDDTLETTGQTLLQLIPPFPSDSFQLRFRYKHDPDSMYARIVGAWIDNLVADTTANTSPCCHLFVEPPVVDSVWQDSMGQLWATFQYSVCFADSACGLPQDTFELTWISLPSQDTFRDTLTLSLGSCTSALIAGPLRVVNGSNTFKLYDNECCTQPQSWTVTGVLEGGTLQSGTALHWNPRLKILVLRTSEQQVLWIVDSQGRTLRRFQVLPGTRVISLHGLPRGTYRVKTRKTRLTIWLP